MKKNEQMIYIKDLLFAALYRWRAIIAGAILLALVLGGLQAVSVFRGDAGGQSVTAAMENYQEEKTALERQKAYLQQKMEDRQLYLENSLLMRLDPYDHYEARVIAYAGTTDQADLTGVYLNQTLLSAYRSVLNEQAFLEKIAQQLEISDQYAVELISLGSSDTMAYTLEVTVKCDTAENAEKLAQIVAQQLTAAQENVASAVTAHSLSVLEKTAAAKVDPALGQIQQATLKEINDIRTAMEDIAKKQGALVVPAALQTKGAALKKTVAFAALGAVAGAFLTVCAVWIMHVVDTKVYSARTLNSRTGVKILGCLGTTTKKNPIDRKLRVWEGRSTDAQLQLLATDIRCRIQQAGSLLITGGAAAEALVSALIQQLPGVQITVGDVIDCPAALEALGSCDVVVLVEQCGVSRYNAVQRRMEIINDYDKQLVGCVVLDG